MLSRDHLLRIALRYDTTMSRAMLRALGVDVPHRVRVGTVASVDKYEGVRECFNQKVGIS